MTLPIFLSIVILSSLSLGLLIAFAIRVAQHTKDISYWEKRMSDKDETIDRLNNKIMSFFGATPEAEQKLKRYYFSTEKSLELARLWDQTNDRTKETEATALLWQSIEKVVPQASYSSANLNVKNPIRFYVEWDESDKDPLKEQKQES